MLITSKDNPKIKQYRKLAAGKKARSEQKLFVVEGMRSIVDIVGEAEIEALFCTLSAIEKYSDILDTDKLSLIDSCKRYTITDEVAEKMSDVGNTQGVFAVVRQIHFPLEEKNLDREGKYLVLDCIQDPGNLGTMIRTAAAVGLSGVILAGNSVDLYNPKTVRSAMGSMTKVKIYMEHDTAAAVRLLGGLGIKSYAAVVKGGKDIFDTDFSKGCAVVIGNEGRGLDDSISYLCSDRVTITMRGDTESLNAAIAGTILVWEMSGRGR